MTHGVVHYFQHTPSDSRFATFYPTSILLPPFQNSHHTYFGMEGVFVKTFPVSFFVPPMQVEIKKKSQYGQIFQRSYFELKS